MQSFEVLQNCNQLKCAIKVILGKGFVFVFQGLLLKELYEVALSV